MRKPYQKPAFAIEFYTLTQSVAACPGIKIKPTVPGTMPTQTDILNDPDVTNAMRNLIRRGGFIDENLGCRVSMLGHVDSDGVCYHTNINAAFNS